MTSAERPRPPGQVLRRLPFLLLAFVGLSVWRLSQPTEPEEAADTTELSGATMGTTFSIKVAEPLDAEQQAQAEKAIAGALKAVNQAMSTYLADSELSRFNRNAPIDQPQPLSPGLREVVGIAMAVHEQSAGALDITVGPLVDAFGFGPGTPQAPPDTATLAELARHVGQDKLRLDAAGLSRSDAALRCDLSAIAKGYAVDQISQQLTALGLRNFMVEVGGEVRTRGQRADGHPFRIGIEQPDPDKRTVARVLPLRDRAMATSGDYRNFFLDNGERRPHVLDPRTGEPVRHALASVTVIHEEAAWADAWATALLVLGPEAAPQLAEKQGLAALFMVRDSPQHSKSIESSAFAALFPQEGPEP